MLFDKRGSAVFAAVVADDAVSMSAVRRTFDALTAEPFKNILTRVRESVSIVLDFMR